MSSDLRYSLRLLAKSPTFTVIAVLTLAIGIGSATVVFSAVNALFVKPLPLIKDSERIFFFSQTAPRSGHLPIGVNYADFNDLRSRLTSVESMWVFCDRTVILNGSAEPERLVGTEISSDAFEAMGVRPIIGRNFQAKDGALGAPAVALLGYELWQRKYGGSPDVIGSEILVNTEPTVVVGVMPKGWGYPVASEVWTPLHLDPEKLTSRGIYIYSGHAKLKPGVTLEQAQSEADEVSASLASEYKISNEGVGLQFLPMREEAARHSPRLTKLLFGAVLFVFLIACVNVANLLLARSVSRSKEVAVRLALGAKRSQLMRPFLTESLVLGLLGGIGGLILALWGVDLLKTAIPVETPFWMRFEIDRVVLGFAIGLSIVAAVLFGVMPAVKSTRPCLINQLKESGRSSEDLGASTHRLRNILVVAEVAIALVLLVGATLLLRSSINLRHVNPGFVKENVLTFRSGFPTTMTDNNQDVPARFSHDVEARLAALPGVISAGATCDCFDVYTLEETLLRQVWTHRLFSYLFAISGVIALFLACIGIYGVMTYNVSQRHQELGMRMALGASPREVIQMVLRRGLGLVIVGLAFGVAGALLVVPLLAGTLYGISPLDPTTFAFVPIILICVALLACYLPSRRITQIDPNAALRYE